MDNPRDKSGRFNKNHPLNMGKNHPNWSGGKHKTFYGYIRVYAPNHPRSCRNYILEHILIAEKKLGRFLKKGEVVHHINGKRDDNKPKNLMVFNTNGQHTTYEQKGVAKLKTRKYKRYENLDNLPIPKNIGDCVVVGKIGRKALVYEIIKCKFCPKLRWTRKYNKRFLCLDCWKNKEYKK